MLSGTERECPTRYTYDALFDPEIWSKAVARYSELKDKPGSLTPEEQIELRHLFAPIFRHYFDPI